MGPSLGLTISSFEDWAIQSFGYEMYKIFFKGYTEKVWGISCDQISADWASQRIKGLNMMSAISNAVFRSNRNKPKTLVDEFMYPRLGAGQLYEKMATAIRNSGGIVMNNSRVTNMLTEGQRITAVQIVGGDGKQAVFRGRFFLSSAPITETVNMLGSLTPLPVVEAGEKLRYRNHIGVNLEIEGHTFPDNWIYINSDDRKMARIANYKNFSKFMSANESVNPITVEYFTFPGDGLWELDDRTLIKLAMEEIEKAGLGSKVNLLDGFVVRSESAYPMLEIGYKQYVNIIREWLSRLDNLLPIGRTGLFKYNNQDHAIYTGLLASRTALGLGKFDPWNVNTDSSYHESARLSH